MSEVSTMTQVIRSVKTSTQVRGVNDDLGHKVSEDIHLGQKRHMVGTVIQVHSSSDHTEITYIGTLQRMTRQWSSNLTGIISYRWTAYPLGIGENAGENATAWDKPMLQTMVLDLGFSYRTILCLITSGGYSELVFFVIICQLNNTSNKECPTITPTIIPVWTRTLYSRKEPGTLMVLLEPLHLVTDEHVDIFTRNTDWWVLLRIICRLPQMDFVNGIATQGRKSHSTKGFI